MSSREQAKQLIREILVAASGRLAGKVRLHKAFYIAHLYYWREHNGVLTDYPVVRLPFGPGIDEAPSLVAELWDAGDIDVSTRKNGPYTETVFVLKRPTKVDRRSDRFKAIQKAVDHVKRRSATALSDETHEFSRSWQRAADGDELDIYLDVLTDEEFLRVKRNTAAISNVIGAVFS